MIAALRRVFTNIKDEANATLILSSWIYLEDNQ